MGCRLPARIGVLSLLLCAGAAAAAPDEAAAGWIGKIVPPFPDGVVEAQGTCIGDGSGDGGLDALCHHAVDVLSDPQGGLRTILVVEDVPHFGPLPLGKVVDAIEPEALDDPALQVAVGTCQRAGAEDGRLLAIVSPVDLEWLPAREAWRVGVDGRLSRVPPDGVACRNEGFGYDG